MTELANPIGGGRVAALGVSPKQLAPAWVALVVLAALAWVVTIDEANGMGIGPGTMGLALPAFIALWVAMMVAMMFPSVAPVAILWARTIQARSTGAARAWRITTFVAGYLVETLTGRPVQERLRTAAACGAFAVTVPGDWEGMPSREELEVLGVRPGTVHR